MFPPPMAVPACESSAELLARARTGGADVSPLLLGRCYWLSGNNAEAGAAFAAARGATKDPAEVEYLDLCLAAVDAGSVSAMNPVAAEYYGIAHRLLHEGKADEALRYCDLGLRVDPSQPAEGRGAKAVTYLAQAGQFIQQKQDLDRAVERLRAALALDPALTRAHLEMGRVLRKQGRFKEALPWLEKGARTLDPEGLGMLVYGEVGDVLSELGRPADAAVAWRRALDERQRAGDMVPAAVDGLHQRLGLTLGGASLIGFAAAGEKGDDEAAAGRRFFRRTFAVPDGLAHGPGAADLLMEAGGRFVVYLDGVEVAHRQEIPSDESATHYIDLSGLLEPGRHVLAVALDEPLDREGEARGLMLRLVMRSEDEPGDPAVVSSDEKWKASDNGLPGWEQIEFDDSGWKAANTAADIRP